IQHLRDSRSSTGADRESGLEVDRSRAVSGAIEFPLFRGTQRRDSCVFQIVQRPQARHPGQQQGPPVQRRAPSRGWPRRLGYNSTVPNPVEILSRTSGRIARVAAARTLAYAVLPAVVAAGLAATVRPLGQASWERWGYLLCPTDAQILTGSLAAIALVTVITAAVLAWRAYLRSHDFVSAAAQVDEAVGGQQQILTFATLVDP